MNVKKNTSIWKLATLWDSMSLPRDFCSLCRALIGHLLIVAGAILIGAGFLGSLFGNLAGWAISGVFLMTFPVLFLLILAIMILAAVLVAGAILGTKEIQRSSVIQNSFIGTAYSSWKDKYCPMVEEAE